MALDSVGRASLVRIQRIALECHLHNRFKVLIKGIEFSRGPAFNNVSKCLLFIPCSFDTVDNGGSPFKTAPCMVDKLINCIAIGPIFRDRLIFPPHLCKVVIEISTEVLLSRSVDILFRRKDVLDGSVFEGFGYITLGSTGDNELAVARKGRPLGEGIQEFLPAVILGSLAVVEVINKENGIATE